ncbi:MAG: DNA methyltransferase [Actinomycetota bacterium]|nr:DNA methyltransferase [Actinomycetota bacterium]
MPVRLNRYEIRQRALRFAADWRGETRERAEAQSFWNAFFPVFGVGRREFTNFEFEARRQSTGGRGWVDVLAAGKIAVEHKSAGQDLDVALDQLRDYMATMAPHLLPKIAMVCDFEHFKGYDLDSGHEFEFTLAQFPDNIDRFLFLAGYEREVTSFHEEAVNLQATRLMADLHDHLRATGYDGHPLRLFLTRLLFILFADDTEIWERGLFQYWLTNKTREDGSDLGSALVYLFQVLDTEQRPDTMDEDLREFTYINGDLFEETLPIPSCDSTMRELVLSACAFDWAQISPAIFGSMFQEVMTPIERRHLGAHYTTESNIMRTIRPLFLDALEADLEAANTKPKLEQFRDRLGALTFFDPACGCGNFLVIAYREIRRLELDCLKRLRDLEEAHQRRNAGQLSLDVSFTSRVRVSQFYGIEIEEFPARIAETAIYLMDHLANRELSSEFGLYYVRFPITDTATIHIGNAMRMDWNTVLPADQCDFLFGNPPFVGQYTRSDEQTQDLQLVWGARYNGYLDYVTGWYIKGIEYVERRPTRIAYVSTNSICQGEPVAHLWQPVLDAGFSIDFAHRTFLWTSEARGGAGVHVVIVGLSIGAVDRRKPLYDYPVYGRGEPEVSMVSHINPYLVEGPDVLVRSRSTAVARNLPVVTYGNKPTDGGHLLVEVDEVDDVRADPHARRYLREFIGARELLYGDKRWCLWLTDLDPADVRSSRILRERIDAVREFRSQSKKAKTQQGAATPHLFDEIRPVDGDYLAIPAHVGEARHYFPVGYFSADVVTGNHNFVAPDPDGYLFALLSSSMFITWMRTVSGRIRADLRFSKTLTWHNFPLPDVGPEKRARVIAAGRGVLSARAGHPGQALADLYDPRSMPRDLVSAHRALDRVVDGCFAGRRRVANERDRQTILLERLVELEREQSLLAPAPTVRRARRS